MGAWSLNAGVRSSIVAMLGVLPVDADERARRRARPGAESTLRATVRFVRFVPSFTAVEAFPGRDRAVAPVAPSALSCWRRMQVTATQNCQRIAPGSIVASAVALCGVR